MPERPALSSNFSLVELHIPDAWDKFWVEDPFFGNESFLLIEEVFLEEHPFLRRRTLCFCPDTGRREDSPFVTEMQWEAGVRKRGVTVTDKLRSRGQRLKKAKAETREFLDKERLLVEQKQQEELSRGILFYLNQCAFARRQVHMLESFGDNSVSAQEQLKSHQAELLKLRAVRKAA